MRHLIPISGKDSCATALLQMAREPDLPYELFFNDVGTELPETYEWLNKVEKTLDKKITRVGRSLVEIIETEGILPSANSRFCTRIDKIEPMEKYLGEDPTIVYFGIRADEDRVGYQSTKYNITPRYPLKDLGIDINAVYMILQTKDLIPPLFFWSSLYERVLDLMERQYKRSFQINKPPKELLESLPRWVFDSLFAWRSRNNCYMCFFQRRYEWVGLLEHHPELFDKAQDMEDRIGNDKQNTPFYWIPNVPLSKVRRDRDRIKSKRVAEIIKSLNHKKITKDPLDLLSITSCGLMCGK